MKSTSSTGFWLKPQAEHRSGGCRAAFRRPGRKRRPSPKSEHDKAVTLEAAAKAASNADTRSIELAGIIKAMMEKALRHGFKPDDSFREFYATIDASTHPVWIADDVNQLRREFLNRCGILGSDITSYTLAEIKALHKEAKEFGDTLIGRLTGAPKPSPLNLAVGTVDAFVSLKSDWIHDIQRTFNLKIENTDSHKALSNCKVTILKVSPDPPPPRKVIPWKMKDGFTLPAGDHIYIPLATYGEARDSAKYDCGEKLFRVREESEKNYFFLDRLIEYLLDIRVTTPDCAYRDITCKVWVDENGRFQIEKA